LIKVTVHLHTILQRQTSEGMLNRLEVELPGGSPVQDLVRQIHIDLDIDYLLLAVNGRVVVPEHILEDGDQVNVMPAISGG
jgi:sulfur carrier protein ThiS